MLPQVNNFEQKTNVTTTRRIEMTEDVLGGELFRRLHAAIKELASVEKMIQEKLDQPKGILARHNADVVLQWRESTAIEGRWIDYTNQPKYVEPSTLNLLVNGNLLSAQEKREFLVRHGVLPESALVAPKEETSNDEA